MIPEEEDFIKNDRVDLVDRARTVSWFEKFTVDQARDLEIRKSVIFCKTLGLPPLVIQNLTSKMAGAKFKPNVTTDFVPTKWSPELLHMQ